MHEQLAGGAQFHAAPGPDHSVRVQWPIKIEKQNQVVGGELAHRHLGIR